MTDDRGIRLDSPGPAGGYGPGEGWRAYRDNPERVTVELVYPRLEGHASEIEVGLEDVRAADSLLIRYDFERDGWAVLQASRFAFAADDGACDPDYQEVAFVQAWARAETEQERDARIFPEPAGDPP